MQTLPQYLLDVLNMDSTLLYHLSPPPGEQIQENAYVIVRLLIHHPECLGPALTGEAIGLHRVYEDVLDHISDTPLYDSSRTSPRDTSDLGSTLPLRGGSPSDGELLSDSPSESHTGLQHRSSSYLNLNLMNTQLVLSFYTSLVRLLAYCAPMGDDRSSTNGLAPANNNLINLASVQERACGDAGSNLKKNSAGRTLSILKNLISVNDLRGILSLPFARDGQQGIVPAHKEAALLFLSRVYGVSHSQLLRDLLTDAFLPDIKTALKLASVSVSMSASMCLHSL